MKLLKFVFSVLVATSLISCGGSDEKGSGDSDKDSTTTEVKEKVKETKPAISLWDNSLREEPKKEGKWMTTILFGEEVTFLGDTVKVAKEDRDYMKVQLVDGKTGWVNMYLFALDARRAAVSSPAALYKRPDISTSAGETLERGDVISISTEQDGWFEVFGKEKKKSGWIKGTNNITQDDVDVAVALMVIRALSEKSVEKQTEKLNQIINNPDFESSIFYETARTELENLNFAAEEIIEGEGDYSEGE